MQEIRNLQTHIDIAISVEMVVSQYTNLVSLWTKENGPFSGKQQILLQTTAYTEQQ